MQSIPDPVYQYCTAVKTDKETRKRKCVRSDGVFFASQIHSRLMPSDITRGQPWKTHGLPNTRPAPPPTTVIQGRAGINQPWYYSRPNPNCFVSFSPGRHVPCVDILRIVLLGTPLWEIAAPPSLGVSRSIVAKVYSRCYRRGYHTCEK